MLARRRCGVEYGAGFCTVPPRCGQLPEQEFPPHHAYGVATALVVDVRQWANQRFMPFNDLGLRIRVVDDDPKVDLRAAARLSTATPHHGLVCPREVSAPGKGAVVPGRARARQHASVQRVRAQFVLGGIDHSA